MSMYDDFGDDLLDDELDDFEDDAYGISERKVARLLKRRAKLEALLPVVRPNRQRRVAQRIAKIDRVLSKSGYSQQQGFTADALAASGVEGVAGLMFQAQSPPGLGRLVRLPFYPQAGLAGVQTSTTLVGSGSTTNPVQIETGGGVTAFSPGPHTVTTPQVSWATLRLVGFETQQRKAEVLATTSPAVMVVSDLQIGGGANLFTHEDYGDATIYDADQPEFAGLRDYPLLRSPNVATVSVQMLGATALTATTGITHSEALLCEVLMDDNYGSHIPGPYARKGALVRRGGSFVG